MLWTLGGLGALGLFFLAVKLGVQFDADHHKKMKHIARQLGLKYDAGDKAEDYFAWRMTGDKEGRRIVINTIRTGTRDHRQSLVQITVN
jgi:hypothetical protein